MHVFRRPISAGVIMVSGLAVTVLAGAFAPPAAGAAGSRGARSFVDIKGSVLNPADPKTGWYYSSRMSVEVALAPRDQAQLGGQLAAIYDSNGADYQHWLRKGQFDARYAPSGPARAAVAAYLRARGLTVVPSASPFLVRATGSSRQVSGAFRTTLSIYRNSRGIRYFANSSPVRLPAALARGVLGVIGLSNTARARPLLDEAPPGARTGSKTASQGGCEAPYPTRKQLYASYNHGTSIPFGYGGSPGCNGLTPDQVNSIYGAPNAGPRGKGDGVTLAVFELSAYQKSDISAWAHYFYGSAYTPRLRNILVDGGSLHPQCPAGDTCPAAAQKYWGDLEAVGDIDLQLAVAPDNQRILVYDTPTDVTGQTELDGYTAIANDDAASSVSTSWVECESDAGTALVKAENVVFEQMAMQGQSMFGGSGDNGPFECITDGPKHRSVNVLDPTSQPWVTSVGGTSFEQFNPGTSKYPAYPQGSETVWNTDNLCNSRSGEGGHSGFFWCLNTGAGGGGSSQFWGRPSYQYGKGVTNPYTTYGNGSTHCALAAKGTPCREVPDISADADYYTPYAEYCTSNAHTPNSECAFYQPYEKPHGWLAVGGTSFSGPLWAALIADRDSFQCQRSGNINPLIYRLYRTSPGKYFHDITGIGQRTASNGMFPARPGYDLATGIGTPIMRALVTAAR